MNSVNLASRMGWTLDYVYALDTQVLNDVLEVLDGMEKARAQLQERAQRKSSGRRGR